MVRLVTIREAAADQAVSERTARTWVALGYLRATAVRKEAWKGGAGHLYRLSDVRRAAKAYRRDHPRGGKR